MKPGAVPTLRDVARRAGVSLMTASRAFRTGCYVSEETRRRVRDKKERHRMQCERALGEFAEWWKAVAVAPAIPAR